MATSRVFGGTAAASKPAEHHNLSFVELLNRWTNLAYFMGVSLIVNILMILALVGPGGTRRYWLTACAVIGIFASWAILAGFKPFLIDATQRWRHDYLENVYRSYKFILFITITTLVVTWFPGPGSLLRPALYVLAFALIIVSALCVRTYSNAFTGLEGSTDFEYSEQQS